MNEIDILWDELAGQLIIYVDNYFLKKNSGGKLKIQPSYEVNYEISEDIIDELQKAVEKGNISDIWYLKIAGCRNINELPLYCKKLVLQFLPRFFSEYPKYKDFECLKLKSGEQ